MRWGGQFFRGAGAPGVYRPLSNPAYNFIFVRPAKWLARIFWKGGDGYIIDGFGPDGIASAVMNITRNVVRLQSGYVYHYAFAMLLGVAGLISWFMLEGGK